MKGMTAGIPLRAVEVIAVFWQSRQVADAKVAATAGPILVVRSRLSKIIYACPYELPYGIVVVIHGKEILLRQIAP